MDVEYSRLRRIRFHACEAGFLSDKKLNPVQMHAAYSLLSLALSDCRSASCLRQLSSSCAARERGEERGEREVRIPLSMSNGLHCYESNGLQQCYGEQSTELFEMFEMMCFVLPLVEVVSLKR